MPSNVAYSLFLVLFSLRLSRQFLIIVHHPVFPRLFVRLNLDIYMVLKIGLLS